MRARDDLEDISNSHIPRNSHLLVLLDSFAVGFALQSKGLNSSIHPLFVAIRNKILEIMPMDRKIQICWSLKALKIPNSNKADLAAKAACTSDIFSSYRPCYLDISHIFKERTTKMTFSKEYGNSNKGRKYMQHAGNFSLTPWFSNSENLSSGVICTLDRLRSGHVRTRAHLASKGFNVEEMCSCGNNYDIHHLIWECNTLKSHRTILLPFWFLTSQKL